MWFYNILSAVIAIIVAVAALYLLFRLFVLKQGNENIVLLAKRATKDVYKRQAQASLKTSKTSQ